MLTSHRTQAPCRIDRHFRVRFHGGGRRRGLGNGADLSGVAAIAFAHGLTIMVFAFAYGPISGGHMNPAVTIGVLAAGAMEAGEATAYIVSQLIGSVFGAFMLRAVLGGVATGLGTRMLAHDLVLGATSVNITVVSGFAIEAVLAFCLVTIVFSTAIAGRSGKVWPRAVSSHCG